MSARALTVREREAFRLARLVAAESCPYFMHALFAVSPVAVDGRGTFGVDAAWRLYMDPALLVGPGAWSSAEAGAVLLHEVGHLLRDHSGRADELAVPVDRLAWNLAGDAEINDDLLAASIVLPGDPITPESLGCPDGQLAEFYYEAQTREREQGLPDDGLGGCGSGAGSTLLPGELDPGSNVADESAPGISAAEADLVRRRVANAVSAHVDAHGRGSIPAGVGRWASRVLAPPTVPWQRVLRATVRRTVADCMGRTDYTYRRPSRRRLPRLVLPSMRAPSVTVSVVIDTSGSMSEADLTAAVSEVQGVLTSSGIARDRLRLLTCDAAASAVQRVRSVRDIRLVGGGGTDMRVGIAAAEAERPCPDVVVVFTDGDTPWPDAPSRARLVCAVISDRLPVGTPSWAATVHVPPSSSRLVVSA